MGTNYYIKRKLSDNQKQIIIDKLMKDEYEDVHFMLPENIHIGKRSSGWKFLWDVHGFKYFNPTKESIFDFLKSGTIIDEFRQEVSFDDFINNIIVSKFGDPWDSASYHKEHPDDFYMGQIFGNSINEFKERFPNLNVNEYGEFYIDDFRCTYAEDFS